MEFSSFDIRDICWVDVPWLAEHFSGFSEFYIDSSSLIDSIRLWSLSVAAAADNAF